MTRVVRLLLAYDGTGFRGWAAQRDLSIRTVEGELSTVLGRIVNEPIKLSAAGRTDAGVHARGQVTSFTTMTNLAPDRIRDAVNAILGPELIVRRASDAPGSIGTRSRPAMSPIRSRHGTPGIVPVGCTCPRCVGQGSCSSANATSPRSAATPDEVDRRSAIFNASPCDAREINSRSRSVRTRSCIRWCAHSSERW
jgi:tRNA pseudouridine synthase